jgi:hypothetical protein
MTAGKAGKLALLWRGDRRARSEATAQNNRYKCVFEALAALGIQAEPAVYADDMVDKVRDQILGSDGVLVWQVSKASTTNPARTSARDTNLLMRASSSTNNTRNSFIPLERPLQA